MKLLTTNSGGKAIFGGIHTRITEQITYSPKSIKFHIIELNDEKNYILKDNCTIYRLDTNILTCGRGLRNILNDSKDIDELNDNIENLVNQFQNIIIEKKPDVILIPGTSLTGYILFMASKREQVLDRTVQEYAGILEKEMEDYPENQRHILEQIGRIFVCNEASENVTYIFPSQLCKETVENIHNIKLDRSHVVWNGVSQEFQSRTQIRKVPPQLTLGYVGRVHYIKNLPFFLDLNSGRNNPAKLKIITDLSAGIVRYGSTMLLRKLTDGEVYYYAPRSKEKLSSFYSTELSASVICSFFETYCIGAIESVVAGTPCLLSDRAGAKEVFEKFGLSKLVYSIYDMQSFNNALAFAQEINFTIEKKLRKEIYYELAWRKVIKKYNKIFEEVVSQHSI